MSSIISIDWLLGWEGFCLILYVVLAIIGGLAYKRYKKKGAAV
ncbi:MAG: hypothetical protein QW701_07180 [Candidatus Nezhaarchaeales archaeon]